MKIGFIPIDNRPVCYTLPQMITAVDKSIEIFSPPRNWLGDLTRYADIEKLFDWLENLPKSDAIILPLDTLAYGGLISSRRTTDSFEEIFQRIEILKNILKKNGAKIYAFSSIMRISDNNINEEEKEYWSDYGKKIFEYSYNLHKNSEKNILNDIPSEILEDYSACRKRNFEINKTYLKYQKEGLFELLVFSKDDCAQYGLNVLEAQELERLGAFVKTGTDEIPLVLLARAVSDFYGENINIAPVFTQPDEKHLISNYEDISVENSVIGQLELAKCKITSFEESDVILYVNNFIHHQGEIVMKVDTKPFKSVWTPPKKPYIIADIRYANGADNAFVKRLFETGFTNNFYGYSAWNTTANTLGSLIYAAILKYFAQKHGSYNDRAFKALQAVRLLDDWAYQANVRQQLLTPDIKVLTERMKPYEKEVEKQLDMKINAVYNFPWHRLFEVEIDGIY